MMEEQDIECQYVTTPLSWTRPIDEQGEIDLAIRNLSRIVRVNILINFATLCSSLHGFILMVCGCGYM